MSKVVINMKTGKYFLDKKIGEGGFGAVYRAKRESDGELFAIKIMKITGAERMFVGYREIKAYQTLSFVPNCSRYILCLVDFSVRPEDEKIIVTEVFPLMSNDLVNLVKIYTPLPPYMLEKLFLHASKGVAEMHSRGIVHRDIKPSNILYKGVDDSGFFLETYGNDSMPAFQLGDLGGACTLEAAEEVYSCKDWWEKTKKFVPPELQQKTARSVSSYEYKRGDVWALGLTFYYALTKTYPFNIPSKTTKEKKELPQKISSLKQSDVKMLEGKYDAGRIKSDVLVEIVNGMLRVNPDERLTIDEVVAMLEGKQLPATEKSAVCEYEKHRYESLTSLRKLADEINGIASKTRHPLIDLNLGYDELCHEVNKRCIVEVYGIGAYILDQQNIDKLSKLYNVDLHALVTSKERCNALKKKMIKMKKEDSVKLAEAYINLVYDVAEKKPRDISAVKEIAEMKNVDIDIPTIKNALTCARETKKMVTDEKLLSMWNSIESILNDYIDIREEYVSQ